jgi:hypothetical protein
MRLAACSRVTTLLAITSRLGNPLDHVDLKNGITLRRIKDDNIKASLNKEPETVAYCGPN